MRDAGHEATERIIAEMEKKLTAEYKLAEKEVEEKLDDYFRRFQIKDEKWQEWVADGKKTKAQYQAWRTQQMAQGERWTALKQQIAADYQNVNQIARATIDKTMPTVYAVNHNYGVYQIEHGGKLNTSLTLYDHEAVERLMRDDPEVLPPPGKEVSKAIARGEAERWSRQKLQSVMAQGILQGESIEHLATRLADTVGESNRKAAIRNARTMATNAQNAGRYDAYKRATDIGVNLTIEWAATLDNRTRHDHRLMHGQRREVGEPFNTPDGYEIMWPAELGKDERDLPQREIWNCRCTLLPWVKGFEGDTVKHSDAMGKMSYDEWLEARPVYNPIDLPEQKAKAIRESYIREYRGGRGGTGGNAPVEENEGITRDYNSTMAKGIGRQQYDSVCDMLDKCENENVRELYSRHLNDVGVGSSTSGRAYEQFGRIYYDSKSDSQTTKLRKQHSTFFHETGHAVDERIGKSTGKPLMYSKQWKNGEFSRTIRNEVTKMVNQRASALKAEFNEHKTELSWLKSNGYLSDYSETRLRGYCDYYGVKFEDIISGKHKITDSFYKSYLPKFSKDKAYKTIEDEVRELIRSSDDGNYKAYSLSDILEGATKGKIQAGWGHGKSYWDRQNVCVEAFAEISEAYVSGPESLATLKKWLPETIKTYDRMIADYLKG